MRFFTLLANQHIAMYVFPTLLFIIVFGLLLGYAHFRTRASEARQKIVHRFPEGYEEGQSPFPLGMLFIIVGTAGWAFFYILFIGLNKVVI